MNKHEKNAYAKGYADALRHAEHCTYDQERAGMVEFYLSSVVPWRNSKDESLPPELIPEATLLWFHEDAAYVRNLSPDEIREARVMTASQVEQKYDIAGWSWHIGCLSYLRGLRGLSTVAVRLLEDEADAFAQRPMYKPLTNHDIADPAMRTNTSGPAAERA